MGYSAFITTLISFLTWTVSNQDISETFPFPFDFPHHPDFLLLCLPSSLCQIQMLVVDSLIRASPEQVVFAYYHLDAIYLFTPIGTF